MAARTSQEEAMRLAIQGLAYIASDEDRAQRFLAATGLAPQDIRRHAQDPAFLGGVLDHLLGDESMLMGFCGEQGLDPMVPAAARRSLPGAVTED